MPNARYLFASAVAAIAIALASPALAQETLTAPGPLGDLSATLIPPASGQPVALILPGSGPTDRDGNSPLGVTAAPYRLLAEALAKDGIGTLRIDKRGMFASKAAIADPNEVTIADYAEDVRTWSAAARAATGVKCVWLIGHSEGGIVALASARQSDICGIILLATPGRPLATVLRQQLQANAANAPLLEQAEVAIASLERGTRIDVSPLHPALQGLFAPQVQGFLIDLFAQNPAAMAARFSGPLLVVQGGRDLQVDIVDGPLLVQDRKDASLVTLPAMNHVLKDITSDDRAANLAAYRDPNRPLAEGLAPIVARFIKTGGAAPK